jgi:pimeloyl-ACP methyl ester carboxylesterase
MIQVDIHGEGEDLVILHGSPVPPESVESLTADLAADHRVLVPHLDRLRVGFEEASGIIEDALTSHGVDDAIVVGHSVGAYRAFQLATGDAIDVTRVVAISPLVYYPAEVRAGYDELGEAIEAGAVDTAQLAAMLADPWYGTRYREQTDAVAQLQRWFEEAGTEGLLAAIRVETQGPDLRPLLPEIDVPVSVIVGDGDEATPVAWSEEIVELLPDARLHVVEGSGHFPHAEATDETLGHVRSFLEG